MASTIGRGARAEAKRRSVGNAGISRGAGRTAIRAITRITGASKNTVAKLLADVGKACSEYQNKAFIDLPCKRIQVD